MVSLFISCVGDSMSQESICGDGPGVGLGIRRRSWWSEIMRDTKARVQYTCVVEATTAYIEGRGYSTVNGNGEVYCLL